MADQDTSFTPTGSTITNLKTYLGNVADAIRSKLPGGTPSATIPYTKSSTINAQEFDEAIFSISAVGDITLTNPASAENILVGKEAVITGGENITGTMPNIGQQTLHLDVDHTQMPISQGYHDGTGYADVDAETITPTQMPNTNATLTINAHGQGAFISGDVVITPMDNAVKTVYSEISSQTITATITSNIGSLSAITVAATESNYPITFAGTYSGVGQDVQVAVGFNVSQSGFIASGIQTGQEAFDPDVTLTTPSTIYIKQGSTGFNNVSGTGTLTTITPNFVAGTQYVHVSKGAFLQDGGYQIDRENVFNYNIANGKTIYGIDGTYVTDLYDWTVTNATVTDAPADESDDASVRSISYPQYSAASPAKIVISGASLTGKLITIETSGSGSVWTPTNLEAISSGSNVILTPASTVCKAVAAASSITLDEVSGTTQGSVIKITVSADATEYLLTRNY